MDNVEAEIAPSWVTRLAFLQRRYAMLQVDIDIAQQAILAAKLDRCPMGNVVESWHCYLDKDHEGKCQRSSNRLAE